MASKDGMEWKEATPELREKAMKVFEEKQRKEQERVARFGQISRRFLWCTKASGWSRCATEFTIRTNGNSFLIFSVTMCLRFLALNGARQKHRGQKRSATQLSRGGRKVQRT